MNGYPEKRDHEQGRRGVQTGVAALLQYPNIYLPSFVQCYKAAHAGESLPVSTTRTKTCTELNDAFARLFATGLKRVAFVPSLDIHFSAETRLKGQIGTQIV